MKNTINLILILFSISLYSQKDFVIPENRISEQFYENLDSLNEKYGQKDLRKDDELSIRIWKGNDIITLGEHSEYLFHTMNANQTVIQKKKFNNRSNLDSIFEKIGKTINFYNRDRQQPIDAFPTTIELNNSEKYKLISFYKNRDLEKLIRLIKDENKIEDLRREIISNLPAGRYRMGMTTMKIDYLIQENKSEFYQKIIPEIIQKLGINKETDPTEMPLILINNIPKYFNDLNQMKEADVQKYEIINDNRKSIYGTAGNFGVVKITTRKNFLKN